MNWSKIKFFFLDALVWIASHWQIAALVAGLLVVLLIVGQIQSCNEGKREKKIDNIKSNVSTINGEIKVLTNEKANVSEAVNKTAGNVAQAQKNADSIRNANYSNTGLSEAERKMCLAYPESEGCR